ncbi:hypothetical protein ABT300_08865 [Streptomyces sp. NPDC001027]|uniref:hypothetical protein n=1 Tax=Streptomyces sp. NPDC001027 TaxID=3154771 RepID=UPI003326DE39
MARCQCGGDGCNCVVQAGDGTTVTGSGSSVNPYVVNAVTDCAGVRGCLSAGPGITFDQAAGAFSADVSSAPGNNLALNGDGLFVPTGAATVQTGCGLLGDGSGSAPVAVNSQSWPFACDVEAAGGGVYCGTDGVLYSDPPVRQSFQQASVNVLPSSPIAVPAASTVVRTLDVTVTNPDLCRSANAIVMRQIDVQFDLPAGGGAAGAGINGDEVQYMRNSGSTAITNWHNQNLVLHNFTVPAGGSITVSLDLTMARGAGGATWNNAQLVTRAWLFSNPT